MFLPFVENGEMELLLQLHYIDSDRSSAQTAKGLNIRFGRALCSITAPGKTELV
jgi:hypothetical protein